MCVCIYVCLCVIVRVCCQTYLCFCDCASEHYAPVSVCVFVCHLERTVKVSLCSLGPVSCQTVRDAAPLKGMLSGPFLSIISPATLIKAVEVHPHVPQAATEKSHLSN